MQVSQQEVTVRPLPNGKWKVTHNNQWGDHGGSGPQSYPKVDLPAKSGAHLLVFNIDSDTVKFSPTAPFWVRKDAKPDASNNTSAQFPLYKIQNEGKQLIVAACNDIAGEFQYQLNVGAHDPLDPVILNGGGIKPGGYSYQQVALAAGLAALAFFFVGIFVQRKFLSR